MCKTNQIVASFLAVAASAKVRFMKGEHGSDLESSGGVCLRKQFLRCIDKVMKNTRISDRVASYGFKGQTVDGNDVLAFT